jgi:two-component system OmpR family sensor kinase
VALREERRGRLLGDHRRHVYVTVSDTGVGIAPEHLPHIFEPFYRVVATTRPQQSAHAQSQHGAGLGLALTQWIVQAHGGVIEAQSAPGVGTTFTVALPLASS